MSGRGWNPSRNKPANLCRYIKGVGLCTMFPHSIGFKLVADGVFYGPFLTQYEAQNAAQELGTTVMADSQDELEEETDMTEGTATAPAPQYVSKALFDKLADYVTTLVKEHNGLEKRVDELEAQLKTVTV